jgi:type II secretion system protein G
MPVDRLTKSLLAGAAASLAVLAVRSAGQQQQPAPAAAQPAANPGTAGVQISATPDGFLAFDSSTGEVVGVSLKDKPSVTVLGSLRKGADGRWDFTQGKPNAAANAAAPAPPPEALKLVTAQADVAKLMAALNAFKRDTGRLPSTEEGLQALVVQPTTVETWKGPYLKDGLPKDPWGNPYVYRQPGKLNADGADVLSFGPDQRDGGGDDIFGR